MSLTATSVNVVCPICMKQHLFPLMPGYSSLNCPKKGRAFDVLFAKTRAKNQHSGPRNSGIKVYQIRLLLPNKTEQFIEFQSKATRFELRSGDSAIVAYYKRKPKIVQNCTIHQYMVAADGCFIATAVYGSYEAEQVLALREFRDRKLAPYGLGRLLINWYYFVGPPLAEFVETFPLVKKPVKYVLDNIVKSVRR
ncbi:MAG TPA: CFI-box-CTERM domain-containing protein [Ktedonobacteraceae bacterium]|nr:CFI-box-CTERM domain-containing protein [Ktedonobacteraceae bacterium]